MSNLENLVPPLDLCKQIPEGKFENSALVWTFDDRLMPRTIMIDGVRHYYRGFPAPTLQEIIEAIKTKTYCKDLCDHKYDLHYCAIDLKWIFCFGENFVVADTLSSAAMKIWIEINKEGEK